MEKAFRSDKPSSVIYHQLFMMVYTTEKLFTK